MPSFRARRSRRSATTSRFPGRRPTTASPFWRASRSSMWSPMCPDSTIRSGASSIATVGEHARRQPLCRQRPGRRQRKICLQARLAGQGHRLSRRRICATIRAWSSWAISISRRTIATCTTRLPGTRQILCSTPEREALPAPARSRPASTVSAMFDESAGNYSWWDYRQAGFRRDLGLRIDLVLASEPLLRARPRRQHRSRTAHLGATLRPHAGLAGARRCLRADWPASPGRQRTRGARPVPARASGRGPSAARWRARPADLAGDRPVAGDTGRMAARSAARPFLDAEEGERILTLLARLNDSVAARDRNRRLRADPRRDRYRRWRHRLHLARLVRGIQSRHRSARGGLGSAPRPGFRTDAMLGPIIALAIDDGSSTAMPNSRRSATTNTTNAWPAFPSRSMRSPPTGASIRPATEEHALRNEAIHHARRAGVAGAGCTDTLQLLGDPVALAAGAPAIQSGAR